MSIKINDIVKKYEKETFRHTLFLEKLNKIQKKQLRMHNVLFTLNSVLVRPRRSSADFDVNNQYNQVGSHSS